MSITRISTQLGTAQLGDAQLGQFLQFSSGVSGSFIGQGILTSAIPIIIISSFLGQGVLTSSLSLGGNGFIGSGVFYQFLSCPRDSTVILYLVPRANVAVVMPIAYINGIFDYNEVPQCGPTSTTIPATGALVTLVEGQDGEALQSV